MNGHRYASTLLAGTLLAVLAAAPSSAQDVDERWLAWIGCWEPTAQEGTEAEPGLVCFRPAQGGVEMFTFVGAELQSSDLLRADGEAHPVSREGCEGTERAGFSGDGRRVYMNGELVCGSGITRTASGVMSLTAPTQWLDVRSVEVDGEAVAWVQRYMLASPEALAEAGVVDPATDREMAVRTARMIASRPIDTDDVLEASQRVHAKAVEAWVAERGEPFELDARELVRLADAGVPGSVTDVMIAVSNPRRFQIDPQGRAGARDLDPDRRAAYPLYAYGSRYGSCFRDPFYYGYSPFYGRAFCGGYYGGYYSPYGFGSYGYQPTTVIVERASPSGRMVPGRGYVPSGSQGSIGTARPRGASAGAGGSARPSTGRTARPRRGGRDLSFLSRFVPSSSSRGAVRRPSSGSSSGAASSGRTARRRGGSGGGG